VEFGLLFKFLHIATMFSAVTALVGTSLIFELALHRGDVPSIRSVWKLVSPTESVGVILVIGGIVFGLLTALTLGLDFFAPWLLIAYVLTVILFILGPIESRMYGRIFALADASQTDEPGPELRAAIADPRVRWLTIVSILLYVAIIFVMVVKPLS
jgi:hypothetical protein